VQELGLVQNRSGRAHMASVDAGRDLVVAFVCPESNATVRHTVVLEYGDGDQIWADSTFRQFDRFGTGRLLIPRDLVRAGPYRLQVVRHENESDPIRFTFPFVLNTGSP